MLPIPAFYVCTPSIHTTAIHRGYHRMYQTCIKLINTIINYYIWNSKVRLRSFKNLLKKYCIIISVNCSWHGKVSVAPLRGREVHAQHPHLYAHQADGQRKINISTQQIYVMFSTLKRFCQSFQQEDPAFVVSARRFVHTWPPGSLPMLSSSSSFIAVLNPVSSRSILIIISSYSVLSIVTFASPSSSLALFDCVSLLFTLYTCFSFWWCLVQSSCRRGICLYTGSQRLSVGAIFSNVP